MKSKHDQYMDALALKVGDQLDGVSMIDSVAVCCAIISFAIKDLPPESRAKVRQTMNDFLNRIDMI
jgi:hypothetical protein